MSEFTESVNPIVEALGRAKKGYEERQQRDKAVEFARYQQDLRAFIREFERMEDLLKPIPVLEGEDISDLPRELLEQLSISKTDELENQIATVVNAAGGEADIDVILVYLFRKFKVVQTRRFLQNKLYRMSQKGLLHSVEGKKGCYSTQIAPHQNFGLVINAKGEVERAFMNGDEEEDDDSIPF